jgi:hypothetical protein
MTSIVQPLSLPAGSPEGELLKALEPYLWVDRMDQVQQWGRNAAVWYEVSGIVKAPPDPPLNGLPDPEDQGHAYVLAHCARDSLFGRAQTAICAAEDAGYLHDRHPEIDVGGDIYHDRELDMDTLRAQVTVRMWLRRAPFLLGKRPRPAPPPA